MHEDREKEIEHIHIASPDYGTLGRKIYVGGYTHRYGYILLVDMVIAHRKSFSWAVKAKCRYPPLTLGSRDLLCRKLPILPV